MSTITRPKAIAVQWSTLSALAGCFPKRCNTERLALVLTQLEFAFSHTDDDAIHFTYSDWQRRYLPWLTVKEIRDAFDALRGAELLYSTPSSGTGAMYLRPPDPDLQGQTLSVNPDPQGQTPRPSRSDYPDPQGQPHLILETSSESIKDFPLAKTGVSAPAADLQPFASPLLPTAESVLTEAQKLSKDERKKKVKLAFPTLEELEAQIDGWWQSWELWKTTTLPRKNKSGEISHAALATILADLLEKQNRYALSPDAMRHGFSAAIGKGVWNDNYIIEAAKGYRA